ncbi:MAG: CYTH domain-containing protein [Roseburia sp.]|nr:CYTH domain-containing protein [Roseburia sp.]
MEIERKYLVKTLPENLDQYPCRQIAQGYLNTDPVVRIRRSDDTYTLTYKGKGLLVREEYNLPLNAESFEHMKQKIDGILITKRRYLIPFAEKYTIELDVFEGELAPLVLAEVEFETEEEANTFTPPEWFGEDVTFSTEYHNSTLSQSSFPASSSRR